MMKKSRKNSLTLNFEIDQKAKSGMLKISGALTEKKAGQVIKTLEDSANYVDFFKLNLEEVTAVDLTCIELLYSTCESFGKSNKPLSLDGLCPVAFTSAVEDVGFSYHEWLCFGR